VTTLIDVARRAGVSKSTASNVIRGTTVVAEATRMRVERAIVETGYHPNVIARSLKARASTVLGIVVPDLTNPFYAELTAGVERAAHSLGYAVLAAHTGCLAQTENEAGRALIERRVDGVVIGGISLGSNLPMVLLDRDIPVVLASLGEPHDPRPWISAIAASPSFPTTCASIRVSAGASVSSRRFSGGAFHRRRVRAKPPLWWFITTCMPSPPSIVWNGAA
jgi:DNA-binding LacI/PurR family transcriptional regulator